MKKGLLFFKNFHPIHLKGLEVSKKYKLTELNLYPETKTIIDENKIYSGDFLMNIGFNPEVNARRTSVVLKIQAMN